MDGACVTRAEGGGGGRQEADFRGENCDGRPVERGASARGGVQLHLRSHAMRVSARGRGARCQQLASIHRPRSAPARREEKNTRARDLSPTDLTPLLCSFYGRDYGVRWRALSQKLVAPRLAHWNTSRLSRQVGRRVTVNRLSNAKLGVRSGRGRVFLPPFFPFDSRSVMKGLEQIFRKMMILIIEEERNDSTEWVWY